MADPRLYFDTSALLPLYRQEKLTAQVEQIQNEVTPVISALTEVEVASTLARWVRMGELTGEQAELLETTFSEDLRLDVFERVALEDRHYWQARHWLLGRKTALRTLDALHRCQPWRAKRRLVVPGSREAALLTRRALRQRGSKVGIRA
ncbi:MAG: type II toxin-antitoxin system VapC family toxin, partial [gamma proteobacterium endosymbiont of Lamellibrachia anaximandri]|nr:type II toxin-antitoxin system VapC family toxin [gamma proteobacterium endosymbiont of Lamellibrachia anaximandri]